MLPNRYVCVWPKTGKVVTQKAQFTNKMTSDSIVWEVSGKSIKQRNDRRQSSIKCSAKSPGENATSPGEILQDVTKTRAKPGQAKNNSDCSMQRAQPISEWRSLTLAASNGGTLLFLPCSSSSSCSSCSQWLVSSLNVRGHVHPAPSCRGIRSTLSRSTFSAPFPRLNFKIITFAHRTASTCSRKSLKTIWIGIYLGVFFSFCFIEVPWECISFPLSIVIYFAKLPHTGSKQRN